ncbi:hypothetical protein NC651_014739 [Populus alba x Populus x berolinensis]|nr:hypothetical protein NC651_014739 [Populus alba x Populus x berolinensis]
MRVPHPLSSESPSTNAEDQSCEGCNNADSTHGNLYMLFIAILRYGCRGNDDIQLTQFLKHVVGWTTLQLTRDQTYSRGFLSARSVTGFLSDVYQQLMKLEKYI